MAFCFVTGFFFFYRVSDDCSLVGFEKEPVVTEFSKDLLSFPKIYRVLPGFPKMCRVLPSLTKFARVLPSFTTSGGFFLLPGFYRVSDDCSLVGFAKEPVVTEFYWVLF